MHKDVFENERGFPMIVKKKILLVLSCLAVTTALAVGFPVVSDNSTSGLAKVYYDYKWWTLYTYRDVITSSVYDDKPVVLGAKTVIKTCTNSTTITQTCSYSQSATTTMSVSLGAGVSIKAIELEASGSVSYSTTKTYSETLNVPAKTTYKAQLAYDLKEKVYKNIVQNQKYTIKASGITVTGSWVNNGASKTVYSTTKHKYPHFYWAK
ncbi:MAG: hypothetical protein FWD55_08080 [Propionibacteriaceae bacterium]|nr:hypothetical protein [Propionibacteriaceae bacterium]